MSQSEENPDEAQPELDEPPQPRLILDAHMAEPELIEAPAGTVALFSSRKPIEEATVNEDGAALLPIHDALIVAVADGCGGTRGGQAASKRALECLRDEVQAGIEGGRKLREAVLTAFERANAEVLSLVGQTTMVAAEIRGRSLRTYNVGDSQAMVFGQRGRLKLRTVAHSPVGYGVEAGLIDEEEALHHEERHYVSNIVGTDGMRIEVSTEIELADFDTLLLASDGVFDNLQGEEIAELVRAGPLAEAASALASACKERMTGGSPGEPSKPDDATFVLYRPQ